MNLPKTPVVFYRSSAGNEPVREWLKALDVSERQVIGQDLMRAQYRWPVGMPLCRSLGDALWEVRSDLPNGRLARLVLCFHAGTLIVLHGFIKKTQKTPARDLEIARKRKKDITA